MKKLQLIAAAFVVAAATLTAVPSAQAADFKCENGFTGPDSDNKCVSVAEYECTYNNDTNIIIVNNNDQNGVSGEAEVVDNTSTGGAITGSVTNENGTSFSFEVTNGDDENEECVANEVKPATPVTPEVPKTPETPKVTAPQAEKPAVLAKTSGDKVFVYALAAAASLAAAAGIARIAVAAYARLKN